MVKGRIHSIETFGSVDGPGIRFIVFLKGCNLRCKYCHNVDTWNPESDDLRTADEVLDFAERYRSYWGEDGGITVSGGEPLLQIDFLLELFKKAKERGINTCIDTAVQPFTKEEPFFSKFKELMEYTDLLLVDIKHIDREEHIKLTGLPNDNIKECFEYLDEIKKPIWIRHVLVPGITDDDNYLRETRKFIDNSFRDGQVKTTGTDIEKILPPMRRFGGGNRNERKQTIIEKVLKFFEKYFGLSI